MKLSRFMSLAAAASAVTGVDAFWRMNCGIIQTGRVDPVVSPGIVSSHVHKISGASNININSTFESLSDSECTSCTIQADKSAYWTPQLYYAHADGTYEELDRGGMTVYYLGRGDEGNWQPFPPGFRMLSGNNAARSYDNTTLTTTDDGRPIADRVSFNCIDYDTPNPETPGMSNINCPQGLRAQIQMQSCWDGVNLYKADQSHVAYLSRIDNGVCPPTHPVLFPHLFYEVLYSVDHVDQSDGGHFEFANGDSTGYGFHGDFFNGWDNDVLVDAIANCLVENTSGVVESCSVFNPTNDPNSSSNCPERSPIFPCEQVHGLLPSLPGCTTANDVTSCPGNPVACAPVYSTLGLSNSPGNADFTSIGCFTEATSGRALSAKIYADLKNMTVQSCLSFCSGYTYAGVEYGSECYCGNALAAGSANVSMSQCRMSCAGDLYTTCGDGNRLNLYKSTRPPTSSTSSISSSSTAIAGPTTAPIAGNYTYKGCYTEATSGRALSLASESLSTMTPNVCAAFCSAAGYPLMGVEYGAECYCGSYTRSGSVLAPSTDCKMVCGGDKTTLCGAGNRLSLYAISGYVAPTIPQTVAGYAYSGCYVDNGNVRAISSKRTIDYKGMTLEVCATSCASYKMFGIEYAGECYCGNSLVTGNTGLAPGGDKECTTTCPGNYQELACGDASRMSIFSRNNGTVVARGRSART